jgi:hypothetical protein
MRTSAAIDLCEITCGSGLLEEIVVDLPRSVSPQNY